tara:strand:- start:9086 stop:10096 length:1011 start_codon:yes stop_codon:yes gene_type:complete
MKKVSSSEAIRRGFSILSIVSRAPKSSRDIYYRLFEEGFNVSIRTVERDLKRLPDMFPFLIEVDDRSKPFTYRQPLNARKYSAMNPTEAICLNLAFSFLNPILPKRILDPINPYLKEADSVLNEQHSKKYKNWKDKVMTINEGLQLETAKVNQNVINSIHEALWEEKVIIAKYRSRTKTKADIYKIHPAGLVYRGRIIYLICSFDDSHRKIIYLPLQRFKSVEVLSEETSAHQGKKVEHLVKDLLGFKMHEKKIKLKLKFSKMAGGHLFETPLSKKQKISETQDGFLLVEDLLTDNMELRYWIRAFGDEVEVIKPNSLRDEFKKLSLRLQKKYESN